MKKSYLCIFFVCFISAGVFAQEKIEAAEILTEELEAVKADEDKAGTGDTAGVDDTAGTKVVVDTADATGTEVATVTESAVGTADAVDTEAEIATPTEVVIEAAAGTQIEVSTKTAVDSHPTEDLLPATPIEKKELTLPGCDRKEVDRFRKIYLDKKGEKQLQDALESAVSYRLYVRRMLQEKGLPPELEYLPVVESNYKTSAKSRSGAIGLWQFMANSVKPFLEMNDYVDERYDPWKSTEAALRKLTDNYRVFNDWLLAIAAYNCGMGALNKALSKSPVKDFWYLSEHNLIPLQTIDYVPKLLAIADIAINSEFYKVNIPSHEEEYDALYNEKHGLFDFVTVNKAYSLSQLAQEMRMDEDLMKQLNPSYIRGFTHPSFESQIRLPLGTKQPAMDALTKLKPMDFPLKYKVVSGDSLWSISRRFGTTVKAICELNGINENDILRIGKIIYIPSK